MIGNFVELCVIQSTNLLLPLVVTPFLVRTLGAERVGIIALAQAVVGLLSMLTDYGFSLTAVREVSVHRDDPAALQTAWSEVFFVKILLCGVAVLVLAGVAVAVPDFRAHGGVLMGAALLMVGQSLVPTYFFQGLEWMRPATLLNASAKLLAGVLILILVRTPNDEVLVNPLLALGGLIPALVGSVLIQRKFRLRLSRPARARLVERLRAGFPVFVSGLSVALYTNSNVIILRLFTDNAVVGYYSVIDKLITALRQINGVFFQVTYPRACKIAADAVPGGLPKFYRRFFLPLLGINVLLVAALLLADGPLLAYFTAQPTAEAFAVLHLLAWVLVVVCLNIPFYQILLIGEHRYVYSGILSMGAFLCMGLNFSLASRFGAVGTAWAVLLAESFVTAALIWAVEVKYRQPSLLRG